MTDTKPNQEPDAAASIRALLAEIRMIQMVAGQCSVEGPLNGEAAMAAAEADRCGRWADQLEALLASPPPVSRSRHEQKDEDDLARIGQLDEGPAPQHASSDTKGS